MTTRTKRRLLDFYASKSWAILEESLQEMFEIYKAALERKSLDAEFDPQAVSAKLGRPLDNARTVTVRDGIAILPVSGPIFRYANLFTEISGATSIEVLAMDFRQALDDRAVRAIVLEINSPGGEVDGTSELAQHIFEARGQKPIIAYVSHLGASAAYWVASACDEIVCADTASLGSIGVVGGVRVTKDKNVIEFVSSQSPNKRPDPETQSGKAQIQAHVDALADVFIEAIARNRGMSAEDVISQGGAGGVKVGQQAVDAGLADRVGTLEGVLADLSNPSRAAFRTGAENVNKSPVLQIRTDGNQKPLTTGVNAMADKDKEKTTAADNQPPANDPPAKDVAAVNTAEIEKLRAQLAESEQKASDSAAKLNEAETEKAKLGEQVGKLETSVGELQKQARATRFGELAKGWAGEPAKHVAMLEFLAQSEGGEESQLFKDYVTQQKAVTEQVKTSKLLDELGSSAPAEGSATAMVESKAKKLSEESAGKLTFEQAIVQVTSEDSNLRREYYAEQRTN